MCSSTCATPDSWSCSSIDPTRSHSIWTAVGARRSGWTMTVRPLARVNTCACGAKDGALAASSAAMAVTGSTAPPTSHSSTTPKRANRRRIPLPSPVLNLYQAAIMR